MPKNDPQKLGPAVVLGGLLSAYESIEAFLAAHPDAANLVHEMEADAVAWAKSWIAAHAPAAPPAAAPVKS